MPTLGPFIVRVGEESYCKGLRMTLASRRPPCFRELSPIAGQLVDRIWDLWMMLCLHGCKRVWWSLDDLSAPGWEIGQLYCVVHTRIWSPRGQGYDQGEAYTPSFTPTQALGVLSLSFFEVQGCMISSTHTVVHPSGEHFLVFICSST